MAGFAVIGDIRVNTPQLATQGIEQSRQHLGVMDILQRHFCRHDIVSHRIYRQMQLTPDSTFLSAVFSDFPLAFTKHFQTR
ncbi:hypothetical protein D3C85_1530860 [compost metagenome]